MLDFCERCNCWFQAVQFMFSALSSCIVWVMWMSLCETSTSMMQSGIIPHSVKCLWCSHTLSPLMPESPFSPGNPAGPYIKQSQSQSFNFILRQNLLQAQNHLSSFLRAAFDTVVDRYGTERSGENPTIGPGGPVCPGAHLTLAPP